MNSLSITEAAEVFKDLTLFETPEKPYSFEETKNLCQQAITELGNDQNKKIFIKADFSVDSIIKIYTALEYSLDLSLLHHRWTEAEINKQLSKESFFWKDPLNQIQSADKSEITKAENRSLRMTLFSSGSEGSPKAISHSEKSLHKSAELVSERFKLGPGMKYYLTLPLAHAGGLSVLTRCLISGANFFIKPDFRFDAKETIGIIKDKSIDFISLVPTMLSRLLEEPDLKSQSSSLKALILGGASIAPETILKAKAYNLPIILSYGLTETASQICSSKLSDLKNWNLGDPVHCGKPYDGISLRIIDKEIELKSPTIAFETTKNNKKLNHFTEDNWFKTGDLGYIDVRGRLVVTGRKKDLIIRGGENIDPLEIKSFCLKIEGIKEAFCFGIEDSEFGEKIALIVKTDLEINEADLKSALSKKLSGFKIPDLIYFEKDQIKLNANHKYDRHYYSRKLLKI